MASCLDYYNCLLTSPLRQRYSVLSSLCNSPMKAYRVCFTPDLTLSLVLSKAHTPQSARLHLALPSSAVSIFCSAARISFLCSCHNFHHTRPFLNFFCPSPLEAPLATCPLVCLSSILHGLPFITCLFSSYVLFHFKTHSPSFLCLSFIPLKNT